ncbi:hypothetical protein N7456_013354 [Penicillium angulare]|uniref:Uncharacterized protein n=1 Tax=Penicillium angulare TaxID=116970 RepID=A0A9W9EG38_9EURO|nr:hypothetical protein N7456_013354 [Penicillium angulare]
MGPGDRKLCEDVDPAAKKEENTSEDGEGPEIRGGVPCSLDIRYERRAIGFRDPEQTLGSSQADFGSVILGDQIMIKNDQHGEPGSSHDLGHGKKLRIGRHLAWSASSGARAQIGRCGGNEGVDGGLDLLGQVGELASQGDGTE